MKDDYGYFGKGQTGYTHYMQAFERNNGGGKRPSGGGKGGCLSALLICFSGVFLLVILVF
jgi:hypothetical protein